MTSVPTSAAEGELACNDKETGFVPSGTEAAGADTGWVIGATGSAGRQGKNPPPALAPAREAAQLQPFTKAVPGGAELQGTFLPPKPTALLPPPVPVSNNAVQAGQHGSRHRRTSTWSGTDSPSQVCASAAAATAADAFACDAAGATREGQYARQGSGSIQHVLDLIPPSPAPVRPPAASRDNEPFIRLDDKDDVIAGGSAAGPSAGDVYRVVMSPDGKQALVRARRTGSGPGPMEVVLVMPGHQQGRRDGDHHGGAAGGHGAGGQEDDDNDFPVVLPARVVAQADSPQQQQPRPRWGGADDPMHHHVAVHQQQQPKAQVPPPPPFQQQQQVKAQVLPPFQQQQQGKAQVLPPFQQQQQDGNGVPWHAPRSRPSSAEPWPAAGDGNNADSGDDGGAARLQSAGASGTTALVEELLGAEDDYDDDEVTRPDDDNDDDDVAQLAKEGDGEAAPTATASQGGRGGDAGGGGAAGGSTRGTSGGAEAYDGASGSGDGGGGKALRVGRLAKLFKRRPREKQQQQQQQPGGSSGREPIVVHAAAGGGGGGSGGACPHTHTAGGGGISAAASIAAPGGDKAAAAAGAAAPVPREGSGAVARRWVGEEGAGDQAQRPPSSSTYASLDPSGEACIRAGEDQQQQQGLPPAKQQQQQAGTGSGSGGKHGPVGHHRRRFSFGRKASSRASSQYEELLD